jgi:ABC-type branched-subunit amino acid transport system substrate-binding protein
MKNLLRVRSRHLTGLRLIVGGVFLTHASGCAPRVSPAASVRPPEAQADRTPGGVNLSVPLSESAKPAAQAFPAFATDRAQQGKSIYLTGISPSGQPIKARLAGSSTDVPAAVLTCGNCHGRDGVGKAEGGITPATITWEELTKDYGLSHPSGRRRPAYDIRSVRRAITMGLDPAGRTLDPSMPRYAFTRDDLDDLVAYLKELGRDADPGITDQAIVVGTFLAPPLSLGELNRGVESVLTAYFQEVNHRGGIYGRRVELRCLDAPESAQERASAARRFLKSQQAFALVAPFIAGSEDELTDAARDEKTPVVGPFTLDPKSGDPLNRQVFYLHSRLTDQARALAVFAGDRLAGQKPAATVLFFETDPESRAAAEGVRAECARIGWKQVDLIPVSRGSESPGLVDHLKVEKVQVVFVITRECQELTPLLNAASRDWRPLVLIPGPFMAKEVLEHAPGAHDRLFLSFSTLPLDQTREGTAEYERLAVDHGLPSEHRSSQIEALAAAKIFVEAMTASGRSASREKLIERLEQFYQKPTGLTRPVTFGPNRRFGTRGAYIVGIDAIRSKLVRVCDFIEPESP